MGKFDNRRVLSANLRAILNEKGLRPKTVCDELGIAPTTFSDWINGKAYPRMSRIVELADYFNLRPIQLIEGPDACEDKTANPPAYIIPVLGRVAAGPLNTAAQEVIGWELVSEREAQSGEYFALQVGGNSMEPRFSVGDTVIIRRQSDVDNGQIAVIITGDDEATLKRVVKQNEGLFLMSLNPAYDPIFFTWQEVYDLPVIILGRVVELRARF